MYICPVCNGLIDLVEYCPVCGAKMKILDRVENYYDDYSPYLSYGLTDMIDGDPPNICSHIAVCPECSNREIVSIKNIRE